MAAALQNGVSLHRSLPVGHSRSSSARFSARPARCPVRATANASKSQLGQENGVAELLSNSSRKSWWSPLFGFASQQEDWSQDRKRKDQTPKVPADAQTGQYSSTEDKFKILRQKLRDLESFHDTMYHSSIATRLATAQDD